MKLHNVKTHGLFFQCLLDYYTEIMRYFITMSLQRGGLTSVDSLEIVTLWC